MNSLVQPQTPAANSQHWAIVGGGLLGMTLAYRLSQQGQRVTLFEKAPELGGLASPWQLGDIVWDRHYHVTLLSDFCWRKILAELGLDEQMQWVTAKTGVYANGQLYSVSNAIEFLQFPPLRLLDKIRLGVNILYGARIRHWQRLETIPVETWLRQWSGDRTFERFWKPLLRSKLGDDYHQASAAFIWTIIARLYAARRNGLDQDLFGYLPGGYARILDRFQQALVDQGIELRLGQSVSQVASGPTGPTLQLPDQPPQTFDQIIVTTPAPLAAKLCPDLSADERDRLLQVQYQGIVCASALLRQPLAPYYVTNITDEGVPFTGVIDMSNIVPPEQLGGYYLVYLPKYCAAHSPEFSESDAEIQQRFLGSLKQLYPHFSSDHLACFQVSRVPYVFAIPTLNYSKQLPPISTSLPGIHILNAAHIVNGTLNVNETVQLAEVHLPHILQESRVTPMTRVD
jgi:protoporphyrinogen oxidase